MIIDRDTFLDALYYVGMDEDNLREDYSGRGMYGDTCVGVVCSLNELIDFVAHFTASLIHDEQDYEWLRDITSDNMGLSTIWYWPKVTFNDKFDPEQEHQKLFEELNS